MILTMCVIGIIKRKSKPCSNKATSSLCVHAFVNDNEVIAVRTLVVSWIKGLPWYKRLFNLYE